MIKEAKGVFWDFWFLITVQVLSMPLTITYTAIVVRSLGPEQYGTLALFLSIMQLVFCISVNWSGTAVLKFGKEELFKNKNMSAVFWGRSFIIGILLIVAFLLLVLIRTWLQEYLQINQLTFWLLPALILAYSLSDYGAWIMRTSNLMKHYTCSLLLRQTALLFLIWIAILFVSRISLTTIIKIELLSYLGIVLFTMVFIKKNIYLPFILDKSSIKDMLFYSWPIIFSLLSGYIIDWIDLFIIKYYFTFNEAGIYQVSYRMYLYVSNFLSAITTVGFPIIVAASIEKKDKLIKDFYIGRLTAQVILLGGIIISVLLIFAKIFFTKIFTQNYSDAIIPFKIMCIGLTAQLISYLYSNVLFAFTSLKMIAFVNISAAIIKLCLDLILIPQLGINGAALATTATILFSVIAYTILIQKHYNMIDYRAFYFILLPISVFIYSSIFGSIINQISLLAIVTIIFLFLSRQLKIFSSSDISLIENIDMPSFFKNGIKRLYLTLS